MQLSGVYLLPLVVEDVNSAVNTATAALLLQKLELKYTHCSLFLDTLMYKYLDGTMFRFAVSSLMYSQ